MAWNTKPETACTAFPRERPRRCTWRRYKMFRRRGRVDDDRVLLVHDASRGARVGRRTPPSTHPNEIFLGTSVDVNPIDALEGIAPVSTHADFIASDPSSSSSRRRRTTRLLGAKCYVPAHGYDPKSKRQSKRKTGAFHPFTTSPDAVSSFSGRRRRRPKRASDDGDATRTAHIHI